MAVEPGSRQDDLAYAGVSALARMYRERSISPVDVVEAHLARISSADSVLRAFITVTAERARKQAREAEKQLGSGRDRGPLFGVPYAVKDQVQTVGIRTTAASPILTDWIPHENATVIDRLEAAGAILVGKLNMMEFALGRPHEYAFGTPRNPWDATRETGGSSSGSAVALAAGMSTITVGEDTGGSVRHPAAHCGVAGLRPTWGLVSRHGVIPAVWELDTLGPMARSVEDVAVALKVMAGPDPRDPTTHGGAVVDYPSRLRGDIRGVRIGLIQELLPGPFMAPEALQAMHEASEVLRGLGASVKEVSIPLATKAGVIYAGFAEPQAARLHLPGLRTMRERYDPNVRKRLEQGLLTPAVVVRWAEVARRALVAQVEAALADCDVLVAATTPAGAPRIDEVHELRPPTEADIQREIAMRAYRMPLSLHGGPSLAVPCGFDAEGLPLSLQIAAPPHRDELVLRVGHAYQQATEWHLRYPPATAMTGRQ